MKTPRLDPENRAGVAFAGLIIVTAARAAGQPATKPTDRQEVAAC